MNVQLKDITVTARDGRVSHLDQVYIRGSHVRFFIVPDMLRYDIALRQANRETSFTKDWHGAKGTVRKDRMADSNHRNAPMFRSRGQKGRGVGMARGRATVNRARGGRGR